MQELHAFAAQDDGLALALDALGDGGEAEAVRQADETVGRPIRRLEHKGAKILVDNGDKVLDDLRVRQTSRVARKQETPE